MPASDSTPEQLYLQLLKDRLLRWGEPEMVPFDRVTTIRGLIRIALERAVSRYGGQVVKMKPFDAHAREEGLDWPASAETMIGRKRLDHLQWCVETVLRDNIPGDLVETGVWRGGASIFMRAILAAYRDSTRIVWVADSFEGLPSPDVEKYPADRNARWHLYNDKLAVSLDEVKANFQRYHLLDDRVRFQVGWFKDSLPSAPIDRIAVLRLDGDMYESTMDALNALYPKLSTGGFVIVDDYGLSEETCRCAVHDFRERHGIEEPIEMVDTIAAFWRRSR